MGAAEQRELLTVLVFEVEGEVYGVAAERVREIVRAVLPTPLPSAPRVIAGVINYRGDPVPLIDVRARFGKPERPLAPEEAFVILQPLTEGARKLALRTDRVRELIRVPHASIVPMDETAPRALYAAGTAVLPSGLLLICDVARFLDQAERMTLAGALGALADEASP